MLNYPIGRFWPILLLPNLDAMQIDIDKKSLPPASFGYISGMEKKCIRVL